MLPGSHPSPWRAGPWLGAAVTGDGVAVLHHNSTDSEIQTAENDFFIIYFWDVFLFYTILHRPF